MAMNVLIATVRNNTTHFSMYEMRLLCQRAVPYPATSSLTPMYVMPWLRLFHPSPSSSPFSLPPPPPLFPAFRPAPCGDTARLPALMVGSATTAPQAH